MLYKANGGAVVTVRKKGRLDAANMTLETLTLASANYYYSG